MNLLVIILSIFCYNLCYTSRIGPVTKGVKSKSKGLQSPINIITTEAIEAPLPDLRLISLGLPINASMIIENNGQGRPIKLSTDLVYTLSGGPLTDEYQFEEMHYHWGSGVGGGGSEHKIDGKYFDMEVHYVFFKKSLKTFKSAINNSHGLAVIAVLYSFVDASDDNSKNNDFGIAMIMEAAQFRGNFLSDDYFDLTEFIPLSTEYFTYDGSLTTPPYSGTVRWIVFRNPTLLGKIEFTFESGRRSIQNTGDRPVYLVRRVHKDKTV